MKQIIVRQTVYIDVPEHNDADWYLKQLQDMGDGQLLGCAEVVERYDWEIQEF